jgi:hypothetical protein
MGLPPETPAAFLIAKTFRGVSQKNILDVFATRSGISRELYVQSTAHHFLVCTALISGHQLIIIINALTAGAQAFLMDYA